MTPIHAVAIESVDGITWSGLPRRQYHAVCMCGWSDNWSPTRKCDAAERGAVHLAAVPDQDGDCGPDA